METYHPEFILECLVDAVNTIDHEVGEAWAGMEMWHFLVGKNQ